MIIKRVGSIGRIYNQNKSIKKNVDQTQSVSVETAEHIIVASAFADVHLIASEGKEVDAHFYGKTTESDKMNLSVTAIDKDILITINTAATCYDSSLKLDILLPKKFFNSIVVKTKSSDIVIGKSISSKMLNVKSESGDISIYSTFFNANINTVSGDIDVVAKAKNDIVLEAASSSGDANVRLSNIGNVRASARTVSGEVENTYIPSNGFVADLDISTISGDIVIT